MSERYTVVLAVSDHLGNHYGAAPRKDYEALAELVDARIVGRERVGGALARFEKACALDISQAARILTEYPNAGAYVSFSERVGIPLAAVLRFKRRRPAHIMIAHRLNSRTKHALTRLTNWQRGVDGIITVCGPQHEHSFRLRRDSSIFISQGIDTGFYSAGDVDADGGYILSVGSESREYETLINAAARTGLSVKILSSSPWSRARSRRTKQYLPPNVKFLPRVEYEVVRDLYRNARLVVVPLRDVDYAAGVNAVLEAYSVRKPVVVSNSRGIGDYVSDKETAWVVEPGNSLDLADAMNSLWHDAGLRRSLAEEGFRLAERSATLDGYAARVSDFVNRVVERGGPTQSSG